MTESKLYYFGTDYQVLPGDKIKIKRLFRSPICATVTYIPGISKYDKNNGDDQWSYRTDKGEYYLVGYDYLNKDFTRKSVSFIERVNEDEFNKIKEFIAPPELESDSSIFSELMFLVGIALIIFIIIFLFNVL